MTDPQLPLDGATHRQHQLNQKDDGENAQGDDVREETRRAEVTDFIYSLYPQVLSAFYLGHIIVHMSPNEAGDAETFGQCPASEVGVVKKRKKIEEINEESE